MVKSPPVFWASTTTTLELLDKYPEPLVYELPPNAWSDKTGRGQVQYWFLFKFNGSDSAIDEKKGGEFRSWKWMFFDTLFTSAADFRKPLYRRLGERFGDHLTKRQDSFFTRSR